MVRRPPGEKVRECSNPNGDSTMSKHSGSKTPAPTQADLANRSRQLNPQDPSYWSSRGEPPPPPTPVSGESKPESTPKGR